MEFFISAVLIAALMWVGVPRRALKPAPIVARTSTRRSTAQRAFRE